MIGTTDTNALTVAISKDEQINVGCNYITQCSAFTLAN